MGRGRPQAPRLGRAGGLRDRAEDRRLGDLARVRGGRVRPRRDTWRRLPGRGRDAEPADDPRHPALAHRLRRRRAAERGRGARRGLHAALGLQRLQRAAPRRRQEAGAEPAQRGRRLVAAEGLVDHRLASLVDLGLRLRLPRRARAGDTLGDAPVAAGARVPHEPVRRAARVDRGRRPRVQRVGAAPRRARLRDRRHRRQGRLVRPAAQAGRTPRAAALGARVQMGADDRRDAAERDQDPSRTDGCAQPVGAARAGRGRWRDHLARDPAQRGGHQPQGHSRRRRRDRATRR